MSPSLPRYPRSLLPPSRAGDGRVPSSRRSPASLYLRPGLCRLRRFLDLAALHGVKPCVELDPVPARAAVYSVLLSFDRVDGVVAGASINGVDAVAKEEVGRDPVVSPVARGQIGPCAADEVVRAGAAEELVVARNRRRVAVAREPVWAG